ncbi:ferredoxin [Mycolicibacterium novocastrense]|uniref:PDR/VanB family oxidoreductase n=1 Tax=Mycolicibacterium novocastrense TaxID=59813 RepID=UPI000747DC60|nr:PDR/VanB family oxidoreductase [Mycolicibacterium novocastrense]KUH69825.1 ferredoxin [Mycolicibacterium novocastrense]KUH71374.1 ferredoxin [Mycolicibacterium novocastrense]KUH74438.1 ferredoxin [Mycolicibacterium novocastrense]
MQPVDLKVQAIRLEADNIVSFELRAPGGVALPPFTAGAHLEFELSNHLARSYSLANCPSETHRYVIAVQRDAASRGGSVFMHEQVRVGQTLRARGPRNNFELDEQAPHSVLIAGGIGITPLRSMVLRLEQVGRPWTLYYAGRDRATMAYLADFEALSHQGRSVYMHVDAEQSGAFLDLAQAVDSAPPGTHFYCCGPKPMLSAFETATAKLPSEQVHVEYFTAKEEAATEGEFVVELARSHQEFPIAAGTSILDALLDAGLSLDYSCMEGICGSCEVKVLAGEPDHRDSVLSKAERAANDRMMICCSGCRSARLVLDL